MPNPHASCKKLICDQTDKDNYILHCRNLKFNVKTGKNYREDSKSDCI